MEVPGGEERSRGYQAAAESEEEEEEKEEERRRYIAMSHPHKMSRRGKMFFLFSSVTF